MTTYTAANAGAPDLSHLEIGVSSTAQGPTQKLKPEVVRAEKSLGGPFMRTFAHEWGTPMPNPEVTQ